MPSTGLPAGKTVLRIERQASGTTDRPVIRDLSFTITGPERIAVTGPNGSGKTTLLALITGASGAVGGNGAPRDRFAMLDQQVSLLDPSTSIRDNFRRLNPAADENACRASPRPLHVPGRCRATDRREPERRAVAARGPSLRAWRRRRRSC